MLSEHLREDTIRSFVYKAKAAFSLFLLPCRKMGNFSTSAVFGRLQRLGSIEV